MLVYDYGPNDRRAGQALRLTRAGVDLTASVVRLEPGVTKNREGRRVSKRASNRDGHKSGRIRRLSGVKRDSRRLSKTFTSVKFQCS